MERIISHTIHICDVDLNFKNGTISCHTTIIERLQKRNVSWKATGLPYVPYKQETTIDEEGAFIDILVQTFLFRILHSVSVQLKCST
jgi:hypothetical protein